MASAVGPNKVIVTGETPFSRLGELKDGSVTTDASDRWIIFSPGGAGHAPFITARVITKADHCAQVPSPCWTIGQDSPRSGCATDGE